MRDEDILTGRVLEGRCLTLEELCAVCAFEPDWLVGRIEEGLFPAPEGPRAEWRFSALSLSRARRMHALERDFEAVPELAALVADMLEEMDDLHARLRRAGLE
ncbi:MAG: MerR family transcriptional regulator [Betaproteobacteria bacterium SG8_39]|nr:MAG: MerR family transcriptional regulator [Betaproteobacteria bacterium SG8_39]